MKQPKIQAQPQKPKKQSKSKSAYQKYQCQYKKKSILTKLSSDSGYPQDILANRADSLQNSNYVHKNKQNLKNFFKDRIPPENLVVSTLMKRDSEMVHPKRIFEIKQLQYELKNKTKMNLKSSFQQHIDPKIGTTIDKLNSNFHLNDKTIQVKQHYGGSKEVSQYYQTENFRRGTKSHIEKRSKVLKKEAYDKVFGPDISSMSRTTYFQKKPNKDYAGITPPRSKSISLNSPADETNTHRQLRKLIGKMHDYKNKLQQTSEVLKMGESDGFNSAGEENMIKLIQNMTKLYHQKTINQGIEKITSLEDVAKLNKQFYQQMLQHKNHRLSKRRELALQTVALSPQSPRKSTLFDSFPTQKPLPDNYSEISGIDQLKEAEYISSSHQLADKQRILDAVKYRFKLLKKTLVRWAALFYIYGIKKSNIFAAFRTNREPFDLEGSYAFFKCIKQGDCASVRLFLKNNHLYAFQIDYNGRSPLSYAAAHNQVEIVKILLGIGVNSDRPCNNGHTSLYYGVQSRNPEVVRQILQKGASPWSIGKNPYNLMIRDGQNADQLQILFKNARKIYLGMQIQSTISKRKEYWQKNSHRIVQTRSISYGDWQ